MKILIADDHSIVREGLKQLITKIDNVCHIDEVSNGVDALGKIEKQKYDFVILDISMPDTNGLEVLSRLKEKNIIPPILILSVHPQEHYAIRALKLGASGYLCKDSIYTELETAIKTIMDGEKYISPNLAEKILFDSEKGIVLAIHEKLSEREFQIMLKLARGQGVTEIAQELFISDKTVSTHRMRLLEKMGLKKNAELTIYAIRNNLIE